MLLVGPRLVLRPFLLTDEDALHAFASDPAVTRYTDWGPNDRAATQAFLAEATVPQDDAALFAVTVDGAVIGSAGVTVDSRQHARASFGYVLARGAWGCGYATEAAALLRDHAFEAMAVHRLEATCRPDNLASARVLEKTGLVREGRLRDHVLVRGEWCDSLLYALVR
ncbi:MAG: GNAT family N-acetyltransferase [Actinobacteria bacterium]|nr:GNAT family N-acetyltransferase [Actinomycetota bacterium]